MFNSGLKKMLDETMALLGKVIHSVGLVTENILLMTCKIKELQERVEKLEKKGKK